MTSQYLRFSLVGASSSGKTEVWEVTSTRGDALGEIRWFGRWRQYAFFPASGTIYNPNCLAEIAGHVGWLTRRHRNAPRDGLTAQRGGASDSPGGPIIHTDQ